MPILTLMPVRKVRALHDRLRAYTSKVHKTLTRLLDLLHHRARRLEHMIHIVMELAQVIRQTQLDMQSTLTLRIDTVETGVNTVEQRVVVMEQRADVMDRRADAIRADALQERVDALQQRSRRFEDTEAGLRQRVSLLEEMVVTLQERLNALSVVVAVTMTSL